jgi:biotin carboxyl carrier protein
MIYKVKSAGKEFSLNIERKEEEGWTFRLGDRIISLGVQLVATNALLLIVAEKTYEIRRDQLGKQTRIWVNHRPYPIEIVDSRSINSHTQHRKKGNASHIVASMPGKVVRVFVKEGEGISSGQALLVVEAMKMQNEIKAQSEGTVKEIVAEGARVNAGDLLAVVE